VIKGPASVIRKQLDYIPEICLQLNERKGSQQTVPHFAVAPKLTSKAVLPPTQGCQMVYFQTKNPN
jgi:hypothetical protein